LVERIFLNNSYLKVFQATIKEVNERGIVLDSTAFFPEGGGQLGDRGEISTNQMTAKVTNTKSWQGKIIHVLDCTEGFKVGEKIKGKLDWEFRYRSMKFHTTQHIISRYFQLHYHAETVSNQLKNNSSRLDLNPISKMSTDQLKGISTEINNIILQNMPVNIFNLPREDAIAFLKDKQYQTRYLNMVPKSVKNFRIVAVDEYDWAACAGVHVQNTSEIGKIILERTVNKGLFRERIYYTVE
jgi:Ser-tRNA(Ala) deacylase AlaX